MPTPIVLDSGASSAIGAEGLVHRIPGTQVGRADAVRSRLGPVRVIGRLLVALSRMGWMLLDAVLIALGFYIGYESFIVWELTELPHLTCASAMVVFSISLIASGLVFGLYERQTLLSRSRILTRMLLTTGLGCILAYACIYLFMYSSMRRRVGACAVGGYLVFGTAVRMLAFWGVHRIKRGVLIIGDTDLYGSFQQSVREGFFSDYQLLGYVTPSDASASDRADGHRLGRLSDLLSICQRHRVDDIVVSTHAARRPELMNWVLACLRNGHRVTNEHAFYERATGQILVDQITPNWFLFAGLDAHSEERATLKRAFDIVVAGIASLGSLPFLPLIALAIKLDSGGPAIYAQDRVGQNGKTFRLYKFRTMIVGAETGESVWATPGDPRVTRVGRFLRRTRLDELPQLYNILAGDMSVVGPRPERPAIVRDLIEHVPYYEARHLVKPGLTGWAQISFRYGASVADAKRKLQFDLYYLKHSSLELDVIILFRTLGTFLRGAC